MSPDDRRDVRRLPTLLCVTALAAALFSSAALAQWPITKLVNVKALPADISVRALVDTMKGFTRALGVRCTYCHVGKEGEDLSTYDFASDQKPEKLKAREMLRMVTAINGDHLTKLVSRRDPPIAVQCATCHRGIAQPRPIQDVLLLAYAAGGVDSLERSYRALRARYYGGGAYDFGEVGLTYAADVMTTRKQLADAARVHRLNVELFPNSGFVLWQSAVALAAAGDTTAAVTNVRKALVINPNNPALPALLKQLGQQP